MCKIIRDFQFKDNVLLRFKHFIDRFCIRQNPSFLGTHVSYCPIFGHWYPLSGDVSSGFQSQSGFLPLFILLRWMLCTFPEIKLWWYTCWPLDGHHCSHSFVLLLSTYCSRINFPIWTVLKKLFLKIIRNEKSQAGVDEPLHRIYSCPSSILAEAGGTEPLLTIYSPHYD